MKKKLLFAGRILLALFLLFFVISHLKIAASTSPNWLIAFQINCSFIFNKIFSLSLPFLLLLLSFIAVIEFLAVLRLWLLVNCCVRFSYFLSLRLTLIGAFFNNIFPSIIGGDVIKMLLSFKLFPEKKEPIAAAIFIDRFMGAGGCLFVLFASSLFLLLHPRLKILAYIAASLFILFISFFLVFFKKELLKKIFSDRLRFLPGFVFKLYNVLLFYKGRKKRLLAAFLISLMIHTILIIISYLTARFLGGKETSLLNFFFLIPLANFISAMPITFAGWGLREFAYKELFSLARLSPAISVSVSMITQILFTLISLLGI